MDLTLPIPQTIGTNFGESNDGVILGKVAHLDPTGSAYYTYAHEINYGVQANDDTPIDPTVTWTEYQDEFNAATPVSMFLPINPANPFPDMYFAVREEVTGFTFNISTAGVGTFVVSAFYSSSSGYLPLTSATYSANFLKQTGLNTITFTPPANWVAENIGADVPRERWLLLKISSGTITTQPVTTGAWETTEVPTESSGGTDNPPFYNPYNDLLPSTGDALYLSSTYVPYGIQVTYTEPLTSAEVNYKYSKSDGTFATLTPISDSSEGFTASNSQTYLEYSLTSTGASAFAASSAATLGNCILYATVAALPTATTNRFSIGLNDDNLAGTPLFALAVDFDSGDPVYQIVLDGTPTTIVGTVPQVNDVIQVMRYEEKIYFFVNGVNIDPLSTPPSSTTILYATFAATDTAVAIPEIIFADWSTRYAVPMTMTFTAVTNFTDASAPQTKNFPAHFYIQFLPPTDFASLTLEQSKTGVAGYEIGIFSDVSGSSVTTPMQLMQMKMLTVNSPSNNFFPNGVQTLLQVMNLSVADISNMTEETSFLLLIKNSAGYFTRKVTFGIPVTWYFLSQPVTQIGMQAVIVIQASGAAELDIGSPAYIYLGT